jgi:hypothetical protein
MSWKDELKESIRQYSDIKKSVDPAAPPNSLFLKASLRDKILFSKKLSHKDDDGLSIAKIKGIQGRLRYYPIRYYPTKKKPKSANLINAVQIKINNPSGGEEIVAEIDKAIANLVASRTWIEYEKNVVSGQYLTYCRTWIGKVKTGSTTLPAVFY